MVVWVNVGEDARVGFLEVAGEGFQFLPDQGGFEAGF